MKSATLTASGSGQQRQKRSIPDDESGMQVEDTPETGTGEGTALPAAPSANIRRRIVVKSPRAAVTTQEAVDGHCKKSDEDRERGTNRAGQHHGAITGQVPRWARQSNLLGGVSLRRADGWNLKNHSHFTVARHLREKIHTSMLSETRLKNEAWLSLCRTRSQQS